MNLTISASDGKERPYNRGETIDTLAKALAIAGWAGRDLAPELVDVAEAYFEREYPLPTDRLPQERYEQTLRRILVETGHSRAVPALKRELLRRER